MRCFISLDLIIPLGIILFVQQYVYAGTPFGESVTGMVAALIGMIPEGIYLLTSVWHLQSVQSDSARKDTGS